ncbi:hypothetical protein TIFTF001_022026 [Ficus carica]|uniref:RNase H type-1 domain-containing protein n=1 Tax=Ficus carica TaxID=3494 RepID=A0AA88ADU0_FICCA|nr:hypothetical protein TIFTF001_022026 [Ficus carica]
MFIARVLTATRSASPPRNLGHYSQLESPSATVGHTRGYSNNGQKSTTTEIVGTQVYLPIVLIPARCLSPELLPPPNREVLRVPHHPTRNRGKPQSLLNAKMRYPSFCISKSLLEMRYPWFYVNKSLVAIRYPLFYVSKSFLNVEMNYLSFYINKPLLDAKTWYPMFDVSDSEMSPNTSNQLTKWTVELSIFDIEYRVWTSLKSQVLDCFIAELTTNVLQANDEPLPEWILMVNSVSNVKGSVVRSLKTQFNECSIKQVPRSSNTQADALASLGSTSKPSL